MNPINKEWALKLYRQGVLIVRQNAWLIFFVILVHALISIWLWRIFGHDVLIFENEDAIGYLDLAHQITQGNGFSRDGVLTAVRTPVYPLFLAGLNYIPVSFTFAILIVQQILQVITAYLLYRCGQLLFSEKIGKIAGLLYVCEPYLIVVAHLAITETVFNFLLVTVLYWLARFVRQPATRLISVSAIGFFLGLLVLTRPVAQYLILLIPIALLVIAWKENWRNKSIYFTLSVCIFGITVFPWLWRQQHHFGEWKFTNIDAVMMYFRTAPLVVAEQKGITHQAAIPLLWDSLRTTFPEITSESVYNSFDYYDYMVSETGRLVKENPQIVLQTYAVSLAPALLNTGYEYLLTETKVIERQTERVSYSALVLAHNWSGLLSAIRTGGVLLLITILSAAIWGMVYMCIAYVLVRRWSEISTVGIVIVVLGLGYFIFFSLGPAVHARYRLPTYPFWFLLTDVAITYSIRQWRKKLP